MEKFNGKLVKIKAQSIKCGFIGVHGLRLRLRAKGMQRAPKNRIYNKVALT